MSSTRAGTSSGSASKHDASNSSRNSPPFLLFGVAHSDDHGDRYDVVGVDAPEKLQNDLASQCAGVFNRPLRPTIWNEVVEGKVVVAAHVPELPAADKPLFIAATGLPRGAYRRIGASDQHCTEDDVRLLYSLAQERPYEDTVVADATMADLDHDVIAAYRRALIDANPATEVQSYELPELVRALGGAQRSNGELRPTVGGVLLFGSRAALRRLFPIVRVDYIRVPGTEWLPDPDRRYDVIEIRDPLLVTFRRAYQAIVDDLPKTFSLPDGSPERKDTPTIPEKAIREALVNTLSHRSYRAQGPAQIIRFQNRLEFRNPGHSLVDDEQFGQPGSLTRNPRIADVFREMKLAENRGTGIQGMRRAMAQANLSPPPSPPIERRTGSSPLSFSTICSPMEMSRGSSASALTD